MGDSLVLVFTLTYAFLQSSLHAIYLQSLVSLVCGSHATRAVSTCTAGQSVEKKVTLSIQNEHAKKDISVKHTRKYFLAEKLQHD